MSRIFTCKNHLNLRWSTKTQAVYKGKYTGERNIFFSGVVSNPPKFYHDMSGLDCEMGEECNCPVSDLMLAPEDRILFPNADEYKTDTAV